MKVLNLVFALATVWAGQGAQPALADTGPNPPILLALSPQDVVNANLDRLKAEEAAREARYRANEGKPDPAPAEKVPDTPCQASWKLSSAYKSCSSIHMSIEDLGGGQCRLSQVSCPQATTSASTLWGDGQRPVSKYETQQSTSNTVTAPTEHVKALNNCNGTLTSASC